MHPALRSTREPDFSAGVFATAAVAASLAALLFATEGWADQASGPRATRSGALVAAKLAPPLSAVTEDVMWKKYNEYGVTAYSRGSLPEAAKMFRNAFKALRNNAQPGSALSDSKDLRLAMVMTNLGAVYRDLGKHASAEQLLKAAIDIKTKQLSKSDPSLLVSLKHYAKLLRDTHRETEAELLDSRADMIAWSKQATPEQLVEANAWSPGRRAAPIRTPAISRNPFDSGGFDHWGELDNWRSESPRAFVDDGPGNYGFPSSDFHPKRLIFRGLSPDDPDVPTWKARVAMERRVWNGQLFPAIIGHGVPVAPGSANGAGDAYGRTTPANTPVVIAPWTSPTFAGNHGPGFAGPRRRGFGGGFGSPGIRPAVGIPAGITAPMRTMGPGGRWR